MKKLLLLLLISTMAYAQPNIGDPDNLTACEENFDGYAYFDLTLNNPVLLQGQDPADFSITYYETASGAEAGLYSIPLPQSYHSPTGVVFVRVTEIADTSGYAVAAFALNVLPRPPVPVIPIQYATDSDIPSDGIAVIDLTLLDETALGGIPSNEMEASYYTTATDALNGTNPIVNASVYATPSATLFVRIESVMTSCVSTAPFTVVVNDFEINTPEDLYTCEISPGIGVANFDLTYNDTIITEGLDGGYEIKYYDSLNDALNNTNEIPNPTTKMNLDPVQTIFVGVTNVSTGETAYNQFNIIPTAAPNYATQHIYLLDNNDSNNQDLTITLPYADILATITSANPGTDFEVTLYNDSAHNSAITTDLVVTTSAVVYYSIENTESGCVTNSQTIITVLPGDYVTPPPTGESVQGYLIDQTLAELAVEGENILWYATDGTGNFPGGTETPLPNYTLLTNETTYYATQTLNNIESTERLAVTVYDVLSTHNPDFISLSYYPNPVTDILNIRNTNNITTVSVTDMLGQTIFTNDVNSTDANISLANLSRGIYFVNVASGIKNKTLKIIKK